MTDACNSTNTTYGYVRVSTRNQVGNNSFEEQRTRILERYPDAIISEEWKSGIEVSELLLEIISKMKSGDRLVVTKVDRFSRDVINGLSYYEELMYKGCILEVLDYGEVNESPQNRLMLTNLLAVAEFERRNLIERTIRARDIARTKEGYQEGRPKVYTDEEIIAACKMLNYYSYSQVSERTGISVSTLTRAMRRHRSEIYARAKEIAEQDKLDGYNF